MRNYVTSIVGGAYAALIALGGFWSDGNLSGSELCFALAAGIAGSGLIKTAKNIVDSKAP